MTKSNIIATAELPVEGRPRPMAVTLYAPRRNKKYKAWGCRFRIGAPISVDQVIFGEDSLQALSLSLKLLANQLYCSDEYKTGKLGENLGVYALEYSRKRLGKGKRRTARSNDRNG